MPSDWSSLDPRAGLAAARDGTIVAPLTHNALFSISGDDATAFLHGQLTNDVQSLAVGAAQWNGWCNPKGRLLATFLLVRRAEGYLAMLPAEIAPAIARRLKMFVLRSKVVVEDASSRFMRFGLAGREAAAIAGSLGGNAAFAVPAGGDRFVAFVRPEEAAALWAQLAARATPAGGETWEWTSIRAGIPTIVARTQEEFVPQMANFELVGGVSFRKGCYPGQEIVARTQYRGILKRRMVRAHVADGIPQPGDTLRTPAFGDQAAGMIANAAASPDGGHDVLAVAQLEGIEARDLKLADGAPLEILELPYAI